MLELPTHKATLFQKNGNNDMYGYIYLTYDTIRKMVYIGKHKSPVYDYKYLGSGNRIIRIKKKRPQTLLNIPLQWATNKEQLDNYEINWIRFFRKSFGYDRCYNIANGGDGGNPPSEQSKEKLSKALIGHVVTEQTKEKISKGNKGKKRTPQQCKYIAECTKKAMQQPEILQKISESVKQYYSTHRNHFLGKHHSEETKKKWSEIRKGKNTGKDNKSSVPVMNTENGMKWDCISDCAKYYGVSSKVMYRWLRLNINNLIRLI